MKCSLNSAVNINTNHQDLDLLQPTLKNISSYQQHQLILDLISFSSLAFTTVPTVSISWAGFSSCSGWTMTESSILPSVASSLELTCVRESQRSLRDMTDTAPVRVSSCCSFGYAF